jgi:hypothetical protein
MKNVLSKAPNLNELLSKYANYNLYFLNLAYSNFVFRISKTHPILFKFFTTIPYHLSLRNIMTLF